mgnify:CR=1 FL=1
MDTDKTLDLESRIAHLVCLLHGNDGTMFGLMDVIRKWQGDGDAAGPEALLTCAGCMEGQFGFYLIERCDVLVRLRISVVGPVRVIFCDYQYRSLTVDVYETASVLSMALSRAAIEVDVL